MHSTALPVTPGAIIGYRRNGTPVRLIAGGSETAAEAPANAAPDPAQPPVPQAQPAQPASPEPAVPAAANAPDGSAPDGGQQAGSVDELPGWAQKVIRDTRAEAAATRAKLKESLDGAQAASEAQLQQMKDGIAKALGLAPEEVTPEQIAAERDAARARADTATAQAKTTAIELAAFRAAAGMQADPNKVLDSRAFVATLDGLDPADPAFAQLVHDRVAAAVDANPSWRLAPVTPSPVPVAQPGQGQPYAPGAQAQPYLAPPPLQPAVPASGPQGAFTSAPQGPRQLTESEVKNMTPQQVVKAIEDGLFVSEGFGPPRKHQR